MNSENKVVNYFEKGEIVIYADNAATTKISDSVLEKMLPFLREQYGNASSQYSLGTNARRAVEQARKQVAIAIGAKPSEIVFTSGGSETNNWVLRCIAELYRNEPLHMITTVMEHHSVLNTCHMLEQNGAEVTYLPVNSAGQVSIADVEATIKPHTKLVSVMLANNEIGAIQPITEIGRLLKEKNILLHTDAVQAVGHIPVDVATQNIDFLTASAHKFNGAKGTGVLYKRSGVSLPPMILGGKQEHERRAGTENVAGIVAAGFAIEENAIILKETAKRLKEMSNILIEELISKISDIQVNSDIQNGIPGLCSLSIPGISGEALLHVLDMKGIAISTGAACNSKITEISHVLSAIGLSGRSAKGTVRISFGRNNTNQDPLIIAREIISYCNKVKLGDPIYRN